MVRVIIHHGHCEQVCVEHLDLQTQFYNHLLCRNMGLEAVLRFASTASFSIILAGVSNMAPERAW
jgi:hypothetical protein